MNVQEDQRNNKSIESGLNMSGGVEMCVATDDWASLVDSSWKYKVMLLLIQ